MRLRRLRRLVPRRRHHGSFFCFAGDEGSVLLVWIYPGRLLVIFFYCYTLLLLLAWCVQDTCIYGGERIAGRGATR